jgi:hypothetical protein
MPRIKTTRTVSIALIVLRIYLVVMLSIILAKFVIEARSRAAQHDRPAAAALAEPGAEASGESGAK